MPLPHHSLHLFQVTNGTGKAVDHRFLIFVDMAMGVGDAMGVLIGVIVVFRVFVMMIMVMIVMITHFSPSSPSFFLIILFINKFRKPLRGIKML